jgi:hypothetical protein
MDRIKNRLQVGQGSIQRIAAERTIVQQTEKSGQEGKEAKTCKEVLRTD